jgi:hypothetical protein
VFAATLMLIVGIYQFFVGIAAIAQDGFFVVAANYAFQVDTTTWGWIHLCVGLLAVLAGMFIFTGAMWARVVGIGLLVISAVANFFFLPYYPLWSLLIIALDIFAIWALAATKLGQDELPPTAGAYGGEPAASQQRWPSNEAAGRGWTPEPAKSTGQAQTTAPTTQAGQQTSMSGPTESPR